MLALCWASSWVCIVRQEYTCWICPKPMSTTTATTATLKVVERGYWVVAGKINVGF